MRKIKIFTTVFIVYEFVMLTILQIPRFCGTFFNHNFCVVGGFKYFLLCIMLPILVGLLMWWLPDIARAACPNKCDVEPESKNIFNEIISKQDIEKFIVAAIVMGIQKFVAQHPKTTETFENILDGLKKTKSGKK